jgi:hypothetical protein
MQWNFDFRNIHRLTFISRQANQIPNYRSVSLLKIIGRIVEDPAQIIIARRAFGRHVVTYVSGFVRELEDEHSVDRGQLLQEPIRGHLAGRLGERNDALVHDRPFAGFNRTPGAARASAPLDASTAAAAIASKVFLI